MIRLRSETAAKLAALREYARETYDELINKLLGLVPLGDEEGASTAEFRASWMRAHEDLRKGRVVSHAEVQRRLGL
ncbi:MAG: hypothetical protein QXH27_00445 [Candidatus Micrarchaeia archaeon]